nr:hypothetical protein [Variovorax boronicumulans]
MSRSNCLIWAVALYWRRRKKGAAGYLVMRRSRWGRFPHFLYMERGRLYSYVPRDPRVKRLPPPVFRGRSKFGDL